MAPGSTSPGPGTVQAESPGADPSPRPSATPTPVLDPATLLEDAERAAQEGDFEAAAAGYRALLDHRLVADLDPLLALGTAYIRDGSYELAVDALQQFTKAQPDAASTPVVHFLLAEALVGAGAPGAAAEHYQTYISSGTAITAYVREWVGDAFRASGDHAAAIGVYEAASADAADRSAFVGLREKIALAHAAQGEGLCECVAPVRGDSVRG